MSNAAEIAREYYLGKAGKQYVDARFVCRRPEEQERRARLFRDFVSPGDEVIDFGCGDGGVLLRLNCRRKIGIEIAPAARALAEAAGIETVESASTLRGRSFDVAISSHSLEHVPTPLDELVTLRQLLKPDGRLVILLPAESPLDPRYSRWRPNEERHLHSWTPLSVGNLLCVAGFSVELSQLRPKESSSRYLRAFMWSSVLYRRLWLLRAHWKAQYEILSVARPVPLC